jgi:hypothetical protein
MKFEYSKERNLAKINERLKNTFESRFYSSSQYHKPTFEKRMDEFIELLKNKDESLEYLISLFKEIGVEDFTNIKYKYEIYEQKGNFIIDGKKYPFSLEFYNDRSLQSYRGSLFPALVPEIYYKFEKSDKFLIHLYKDSFYNLDKSFDNSYCIDYIEKDKKELIKYIGEEEKKLYNAREQIINENGFRTSQGNYYYAAINTDLDPAIIKVIYNDELIKIDIRDIKCTEMLYQIKRYYDTIQMMSGNLMKGLKINEL